MKTRLSAVLWLLLGIAAPSAGGAAPAALEPSRIPEPLKSWSDWARWSDQYGLDSVPGNYQDPQKTVPLWPTSLEVTADQAGGSFVFHVEAYARTWAVLPGSREMWPVRVGLDEKEAPVLEHNGHPALLLPAGRHTVVGTFVWEKLPRTLQIPNQTGILTLKLSGQEVQHITWNTEGILWLERQQPEPDGARDFAELKIYRVLEDGAPMWLRTELELTVSGKNRELELGGVLPSGWLLAGTGGPLPMAVDSAGRLKVQARAGKWTLHADAFSLQPTDTVRFAPDVPPAASHELVALKTAPGFRVIELSGVPTVDVSQTTFPQKWRELPVFRWETKAPFRIEERMRGMGRQQVPGLNITRRLWLDEDGRGLTFRDHIAGTQQTIWRLDSAPGQQLGSVRNGGEGQLVTKNPATGDVGVEVRARVLKLEATGRIENARTLPASGWKTDAASTSVTLHLPPGWRLFALFGADYVRGDWLTAWTLLDLFVVLVFSMGAARVFGRGVGVLAFCALVCSYREPEAPRYTWLFLLAALALARVVPEGWGSRLVRILKTAAVLSLLLVLLPFLATQIQQTLHPQLENIERRERGLALVGETTAAAAAQGDTAVPEETALRKTADSVRSDKRQYAVSEPKRSSQFSYDASARIQTGPPVPDWTWRTASYGWNGPVAPTQQVRLWLLSTGEVRALTALRIALLAALCWLLLDVKKVKRRLWTGAPAALFIALLGSLCCNSLAAETSSPPSNAADAFPTEEMLQLLRDRIAPESDAFPHAADIPSASLEVQNERIVLNAEIHVAVQTAVPLPGKLPVWSPLRVTVDDAPQAALRREDGFLWVALDAGVHRVRVEGVLNGAPEWEWAFHLKPRRVAIRAPEWQVSGVRPNGVPEEQVFFRSKQARTLVPGGYDQQDLRPALLVERRLELGFRWQVHTTVQRLSPEGRAVALRVPLLPGERVLTGGLLTADGAAEVRLGAAEKSTSWSSELPEAEVLELTSRQNDSWVEQWTLVAAPKWSVALEGLPPVYAPQAADLVPRWNPWPGETARLKISRAEAHSGATITVSAVQSETSVGLRQRTQRLSLSVRSSLGEDFNLRLPADAEVRSLKLDGRELPVRIDSGQLQVPLHPGDQSVEVDWQSTQPLQPAVAVAPVVLPVPCANVQTVLKVPDGRWVLWTHGPLRGPAVRFWSVLICSVLAGTALGRLRSSPLGSRDWVLLCMGLTQVSLPAAFTFAGWLLCLTLRARQPYANVRPWIYNLLQTGLVFWTLAALAILASAVAKGLLGTPEMFVTGNGSSHLVLRWYEARNGGPLPQPGCVQISLWWYRLAMLLWALWLAGALLGWLRKGWEAFSTGGPLRSKNPQKPPPLPSPGQDADQP
jgi:hypothetical protein